LILEQESLESFSAEAVTQQVLQDVAGEFQKLITNEGLFGAARVVGEQVVQEAALVTTEFRDLAQGTLSSLLRAFWPVIAVLLLIAVVGVAVLLVHVSTGASNVIAADILTPATAILGAVGLYAGRPKGPPAPNSARVTDAAAGSSASQPDGTRATSTDDTTAKAPDAWS